MKSYVFIVRMAGLLLLLAMVAGIAIGCREWTAKRVITWAELISQLGDFDRMARLDVLASPLLSSYDPTGGNDDYNKFLRKSRTPGWVVLTDLKGPGYVSRLWFTCSNFQHPIRFFFDGEKQPRIETTLADFCGTKEPFLQPLAGNENFCWYSFLPIPYQKRLVIETRETGTEPGGWPRLFHQINYTTLPPGQTVASFPAKISAEDMAQIRKIREQWRSFPNERPLPGHVLAETNVLLGAGMAVDLFDMAGPALLRSLWIRPDFDAVKASAVARENILRDVVLRIRWNQSPDASVEAPLGDFFGSCWQRSRYQCLYFGLTNNTFVSRWPMPFEKSARISIENQGTQAVVVQAGVGLETFKQWDPAWGYFHSGWYRTGPEDIGRPHPVLRMKGRGKYVGCLLSATSADRSYWMLEGDESIRKDKEEIPGWLGTGLEDYFNSGWYYRNVQTFSLHGLPFKAPFRTVQYSLHLMNPTLFQSSLDMVFERGPNHASKGWMESVAFYYMEQPCQTFARLGTPEQRRPPPDVLAQATLMTEIWNFERLRDLKGASDYIDRYLEHYTNFPFKDVLRLRQLAYTEREKGFETVRPAYEQIAASTTNEMVRQFANILLWYQQSPSNAMVGAYANTRTRLFLDNKLIGEAGDPERMLVWGIPVGPGRHVLAMEVQYKPYPSWVQMILRTHRGDVFTMPGWKYAVNPLPGWLNADYDDRSWKLLDSVTKGPPEEPYIWVMPDPFVDVAKAGGLAASFECKDQKKTAVYRTVFDLP
ncbi:MAG: DUF2961 domain-containing protein [Kiritimatiellaeota bacterium]|nr:DUF2961 domain-containing protein [Kiritimatiellota bacterium]